MSLTDASIRDWGQSGSGNVTTPQIREKLTADRDYYVRSDGSDANTGLADTAGGAFATYAKALAEIGLLDFNGYTVNLHIRAGTWTPSLIVTCSPQAGEGGAGLLNIIGDITTPSNVVISTTSADAIICAGARCLIKGFKLQTTTSGRGIYATSRSTVGLYNIDFGACVGGHITSYKWSLVIVETDYTISGNAGHHMFAEVFAQAEASGKTITVPDAFASANYFAHASQHGIVTMAGDTFSGGANATGKRFDGSLLGLIRTDSGNANYFPGNSAGSNTTGSIYN